MKGKKYKCMYGLTPEEMEAAAALPPKEKGVNTGELFNIGAQALNAYSQVSGKVASTLSNGLDVANSILGAIDSSKLRRREQQQISEALQKRAYEGSGTINNIPIYTKYGGVLMKNGGGASRRIEAEHGEVMEMEDGSLVEVDGKRHEQGGEDFTGVYKVLEDTATKRKDPLSKALAVPAEQASAIIGKPVKRALSHSDVFSKAADHLEKTQAKYVKNIELVEEQKTPNLFAINAARMNTKFGQKLPTQQEIFDALFDHQEIVKAGYEVSEDNKAAYGAGPIKPYRKGKQKTPTGKDPNFQEPPTFDEYFNTWQPILGLTKDMDSEAMQSKMYDHLLSTPEGKQQIKDMWKTYGNTRKGLSDPKLKGYKFNNLNDDQLKNLKGAYTDGLLGARTLKATPPKPAINNEEVPIVTDYEMPEDPKPETTPNYEVLNPPTEAQGEATVGPEITENEKSKFKNPMKWFDTIGNFAGIVDSFKREPELYNPARISKARFALQDPRGALNRTQADYNAVSQGLGNSSVDQARKAQLLSSKLRSDADVLANTENANTQIRNQEEQYNANASDRQELSDQQTRQSYYDRVLQARENQSAAKQSAFNALGDKYAQHNAFNKNAELLMKLAPAFDQNADYNGYKTPITNNGVSATGAPATTGMQKYRVTTKDGKVQETFMTDAEYKLRIKDPSLRIQRYKTR